MKLIEIAKLSAEGIVSKWDEWETEALQREQQAQNPQAYSDLMIEFLSAEIEERMASAFNRGYIAAANVAEKHKNGGCDSLFASVEIIHSRGDAYSEEFPR